MAVDDFQAVHGTWRLDSSCNMLSLAAESDTSQEQQKDDNADDSNDNSSVIYVHSCCAGHWDTPCIHGG